jgi:hypothetical protein
MLNPSPGCLISKCQIPHVKLASASTSFPKAISSQDGLLPTNRSLRLFVTSPGPSAKTTCDIDIFETLTEQECRICLLVGTLHTIRVSRLLSVPDAGLIIIPTKTSSPLDHAGVFDSSLCVRKDKSHLRHLHHHNSLRAT